MTREEQLKKLDAMAKPRSEEAIKKAEERKKQREVIDLFERLEAEEKAKPYCRTCKHRKRYELNERSRLVVQCCDLQHSNRSNSGYKTIKVTDKACGFYEPKERE